MENIESVRSSEIKPEDDRDKRCAPGKKFEDGSCADLDVLIDIAEEHGQIKLYPEYETLNPKKYKRYLVKQLNKSITSCNTQRCWMDQSFTKALDKRTQDKLLTKTFRPTGPDGKFEWLNTVNIDEVMTQYEDAHPSFKFLGAVPIDFDDLPVLGIKNLNFKTMVGGGKTELGIVFNLDEHDQPGSHWVAMYSNLKKGQVYFFDSYGIVPEPRIRKLMRRVANFCQNDLKIKKIDARYNKERAQYGGSECGVYSMNFIIRLIKGNSFDEICSDKTPDKVINKCRNVYFNNQKV